MAEFACNQSSDANRTTDSVSQSYLRADSRLEAQAQLLSQLVSKLASELKGASSQKTPEGPLPPCASPLGSTTETGLSFRSASDQAGPLPVGGPEENLPLLIDIFEKTMEKRNKSAEATSLLAAFGFRVRREELQERSLNDAAIKRALVDLLFGTEESERVELNARDLQVLKLFLREKVFGECLESAPARKKKQLGRVIAGVGKQNYGSAMAKLRQQLRQQPVQKSRKLLFPKILKQVRKRKPNSFRKLATLPNSKKELNALKSNPAFVEALNNQEFAKELLAEARQEFLGNFDHWLDVFKNSGASANFELGVIRPQIDQIKYYFE